MTRSCVICHWHLWAFFLSGRCAINNACLTLKFQTNIYIKLYCRFMKKYLEKESYNLLSRSQKSQNLKSQPFPRWIQKKKSVPISPTSHQYQLIQYHSTPLCPFWRVQATSTRHAHCRVVTRTTCVCVTLVTNEWWISSWTVSALSHWSFPDLSVLFEMNLL